jgi:hypothetical protein
MHAAENFQDTVIADRLLALTRDEPDLTALVRRLQDRPGTAFSSGSAWERDASTERPQPKDQRVVSLRRRLGRTFG